VDAIPRREWESGDKCGWGKLTEGAGGCDILGQAAQWVAELELAFPRRNRGDESRSVWREYGDGGDGGGGARAGDGVGLDLDDGVCGSWLGSDIPRMLFLGHRTSWALHLEDIAHECGSSVPRMLMWFERHGGTPRWVKI
jgi:hypothetical protein